MDNYYGYFNCSFTCLTLVMSANLNLPELINQVEIALVIALVSICSEVLLVIVLTNTTGGLGWVVVVMVLPFSLPV